jgi:hypothetical protein
MIEIKLLNKLKETLEQARRLAETTGNSMQVYLIDMAILEADQMSNKRIESGGGESSGWTAR